MRARPASATRASTWCAPRLLRASTSIAVPGPCAAVAALSIGGAADRPVLLRGIPAGARAPRAARGSTRWPLEPRTLVFYESPHRVRETLEDCAAHSAPARGAVVARELTKLHETLYRGSLGDLARARTARMPDLARGEIVLVIAGAPRPAAGSGWTLTVMAALLDRALGAARGAAAETGGASGRAITGGARQRGLQARAAAQSSSPASH